MKMMLSTWIFNLMPATFEIVGIFVLDLVKPPYKADFFLVGAGACYMCSFISINLMPSLFVGGLSISIRDLLFCRICKQDRFSVS